MAVTDLRSASSFEPAPFAMGLLGLKGSVYTATLAGTATLDNTYPTVLKLDPGGANRDVTLDTESTHEGLHRFIINAADASENLVCKETSGDGGSTIATINQNEWAFFYSDGADWQVFSFSTFADLLATANTWALLQTFTSGIASNGRATTTDGVTSGTARVIGGRAASSTAASTTIAGGSGAQAYDVTYAIPANTLKAGSHTRIAAVVKAIAQNGTDTFLAQLRVGGTVVATAGAVDIAANDRAYLSCDLDCYAAPGGSVTVVYGGLAGWSTSGAGPNITGGALTLATNGAVTVDVVITYGSSNSGNTSALEALVVNIT
jgi:hypothetical protein